MATLDSFERLRKRYREDTDMAGQSMETGRSDVVEEEKLAQVRERQYHRRTS